MLSVLYPYPLGFLCLGASLWLTPSLCQQTGLRAAGICFAWTQESWTYQGAEHTWWIQRYSYSRSLAPDQDNTDVWLTRAPWHSEPVVLRVTCLIRCPCWASFCFGSYFPTSLLVYLGARPKKPLSHKASSQHCFWDLRCSLGDAAALAELERNGSQGRPGASLPLIHKGNCWTSNFSIKHEANIFSKAVEENLCSVLKEFS